MGVQIICVFREEEKGATGALRVALKSSISPILLDTPVDKTKAYSEGGFTTYFIGGDGKIKAELSGTKGKRPTGKDIFAKAKMVFK